MNVRTCASFLTAAVLATHAVTPAAQAPPASSSRERAQDLPTFRSDVRLIDIDVFVTDRDGNFVRDLTKDDFEIIEDGNVQDVKTFSFIDLPTESVETAGTAALPEPDVTTNDADGRIYVIIMDSPSTADPDESVGGITYTASAKRVARQFLDGSVMPGDQLAVVHAQGTFNDSQTFTTSRRLVSDSIDRYGRGMSGADNLITGSERVQRQLDSFRALQNVAERLGAMSGRRKAIVWIGAQMVFNLPRCPSAVPDCEAVRRSYPSILSAYRDAIGAATRNNVAIYPVDPSGLTTAMGAIELDRLSALRVVAEDTGGLAVVNTNNFAGGYEAILRDNSTYYVLGYSPATEHRDGKFHPVTVRVKRPGLTVRARKGYIAPESESKAPALPRLPEGVSEAAREALRQPLGVKGLSIALTAVPFKGTGKDRSVLVSAQITGADLQLAPGTGIASRIRCSTPTAACAPASSRRSH
jgi:VWFA-related protein